MRFVNHQHIQLRPIPTLGNGLSRCNLQQLLGLATPMVGLDDSMIPQAVAVSSRRRLVDQGCAVAHEHGTLTLLHSLMTDTQAKVSFTGSGGGHDHLVFVACLEPYAEIMVGTKLEWARKREGRSIITHSLC